ncbi:MAG TPA: hypothetical protein VFQ35_01800 [Polyangiaceae bacterium]|nr:hypothetical protein [Polyangiaceae bacterium]
MIRAQRFGRGMVLAIGVGAVLTAASCAGLERNADDDGFGTGGVFSPPAGGSLSVSGGATNSAEGGHAPSGSGGASGAASGGQSSAGAAGTGSGGAPTSSGGAQSTGGATQGGSGGAASTCSDLPPNNGDTCAHAVEWGWCKESWLGNSCLRSCGKCNGSSSGAGGSTTNGGASSSGGASNGSSGGSTGSVEQPPRIDGGSPGWASRYWDCCKPACGWKGNVPGGSTPVSSCTAQGQSMGGNYDARNACESGGSAYMCQDFGPWAVSDTLAYGFAAVSRSDYCGRCYQLQFTGKSHNATTDAGSASLSNKTMIVQAINNGGVGSDQFDLLIPGGGVGDFDACSSSWGTSSLGERYGGFFLACQKQNGFNHDVSKACAKDKCQSVFANKPDLLRGCLFFTDWFNAPDNPALVFKEVTCPAAITNKSGLKR